MTGADHFAALLNACADVPARLSAVERQNVEVLAKLAEVQAALPPMLVTISQAAAAWKVSVPTMRRWIKDGAVPHVRVGSTVRVDLSRLRGSDAADIAARVHWVQAR